MAAAEPVRANWGHQNRTCAIRVSAPDRVEYRTADSIVNPYLMAGALLKAIDDGLSSQLEPGPATDANSYSDHPAATIFVPRNLGQALEALDNDPVVLSALPGDMSELFRKIKMNEWDEFLATVTIWDFNTYLDHTP